MSVDNTNYDNSTNSSSTTAPPLLATQSSGEPEWQFAQSFGTEETEQGFNEEDVFSALAFSHTGQYISLGDKAGRITVFEVEDEKNNSNNNENQEEKKAEHDPIEYKFYTEFQSHTREFDRLHSVPIPEAIKMIRWFPMEHPKSQFMLSTNDTTVKLWKVGPRMVRRKKKHDTESAGLELRIPQSNKSHFRKKVQATCKREFQGGNTINSISISRDCQNMIASDLLKVNMWNIEYNQACHNIVNLSPDDMKNLTQIVTSSTFHPKDCSLFLYSTSLGGVNFCDTRVKALMDTPNRVYESLRPDGFYTDLLCSVSDASFSACGRYVIARDYFTSKIWDIRSERAPMKIFHVHQYLEDYVRELYDSGCIEDRFELASSPDGNKFVTGSYDSNFVVHSLTSGETETIHATSDSVPRRRRRRPLGVFGTQAEKENAVSKMNFLKKSLHLSWHPSQSAVAIASLNKVYIYQSS